MDAKHPLSATLYATVSCLIIVQLSQDPREKDAGFQELQAGAP